MENIRVYSSRYSFLQADENGPSGRRHWQHLVAKICVTIMASHRKIERVVVEVSDLILENISGLVAPPAIECGRGNAILVRSDKALFQLRLDPRAYAQTVEFLKRHKIQFLCHKLSKNDYRLLHPLMTSRPSSCHLSSSLGSLGIPSSIYHMESPHSINLCSSPASFASSFARTIVAPGDLSSPISRYGILFAGAYRWSFVYKNSFMRCVVKSSTLQLVVTAEMETLHSVDLRQAVINREATSIEFSDGGDRIILRLNRGFIGKLCVLMQKDRLELSGNGFTQL